MTNYLTEREQEVLGLVSKGKRNKEIAATLSIEISTVEKHTNAIYNKLGVTNRTEATCYWFQNETKK